MKRRFQVERCGEVELPMIQPEPSSRGAEAGTPTPVVPGVGEPSGPTAEGPTEPKCIVAAGGLLVKGRWSTRLAVVHRPKYDDWTLPKGKLEMGESCEQAALREVCEETGCRARLGRLAGLIQYRVQGGLKLALFWRMEVEVEGACQLGDDVDRVLWLSPAEAVAQLSHPAEQRLVEREFAGWRVRWLRGLGAVWRV